MATIECCETLSSSTKAKLQDAGILYLADLTYLLSSDDDYLGADQRTARALESLRKRIMQRASLHAQTAGTPTNPADAPSVPHAGRAATELSVTVPLDRTCSFTESEIEEIFEAMRAVTRVNEAAVGESSSVDVSGGMCNSDDTKSRTFSKPESAKNTAEERSRRIPGCRSLREICAEAQRQYLNGHATHATTFSRELDALLGGGVPVGGVTEVSGPPGVGKTQLLMQLAVSCTMPVEFGGLGGTCLFVDTEGSFVAERLEQMATAAVSLVKTILAKDELQNEGKTRKRTRSSSPDLRNGKSEFGTSVSLHPRDGDNGDDGGSATEAQLHHLETNNCGSVDTQTKPKETAKVPTRKARLTHGDFTVDFVLQRVRYIRVTELTDFLAVLYSLPMWLKNAASTTRSLNETTRNVAPVCGSAVCNNSETFPLDNKSVETVRLLLIDSIALPLRASDSFEKNAHIYDSIYGGTFNTFDNSLGSVKGTTPGALSKQGLWQRSRLLYQCSTTLAELAASFQLAVVVSNHMTTKLLRTTTQSGHDQWTPSTDGRDQDGASTREYVLIPALGNAWGHGLSARLLLAFHHYELPSCAFATGASSAGTTAARGCAEDIVYGTTDPSASTATPSLFNRVAQHRVARLLKASGRPRRETCFLITTKGIRDGRKEMVQQRVEQKAASLR